MRGLKTITRNKNGLKLLKSNKATVKTDIKTLKDFTREKKTESTKTAFIQTGNELNTIKYAIENKKNVLVTGHTGTGKTFLIEQLSKEYNAKTINVSCDIDLDKNDLIGHYEYINDKTVWIDGAVITALKNGYWLILDEINFSKSEVLPILNSVLDYRKRIELKEHNNELINAHKNFRVFATMNANYTGTNDLNQAFRNRFPIRIELEYLSKENEIKLIKNTVGIKDKTLLEKIVNIACDSRRMQKDGKIFNPISTRNILEFSEMLHKNTDKKFNIIDIAKATLNLSDETSELDDILNIVKNYFSGAE